MLKMIIDTLVNYQGDPALIWAVITPQLKLYLGAWLAAMISFRALDAIERSIYPEIRHDIMNTMLNHIFHHSHGYFQDNFSGSISNRIVDMQSGVVSIIRKVDEAIFNIIFVSFGFTLLFTTNALIAYVFLAWLLFFTVISTFFLKNVTNLATEFSRSKTALVGYFVDVLSNINIVRFFSGQEHEAKKADKKIHTTVLRDKAMRKNIIIMRTFWDTGMYGAIVTILYLMVYLYSQNLVSVGDFAFVISLSMGIFHSIWHLTSQYAEFSEELGKCYQALEIIEKPHDILDADNAVTLKDVQGSIEFKNVTFQYDHKALFRNMNLQIKPQEKVGLVGFSGSGKSTFVNLIMRLFDIQDGQICIDGHPVSQISQRSLRKNIAIIPQDPSLFHRTIKENIAYGNPNATDEDIIRAAKFAHCDEFIEGLERKYNTLGGERGVKLSGGQRQRVSIARAFLENAPILILDEATSALDSVTEEYIQESLFHLMQNKTTIVIAHRLSTLSQMDRILVFDKGSIIEEGTHASLIKANGHYAKMWAIQAKSTMLSD